MTRTPSQIGRANRRNGRQTERCAEGVMTPRVVGLDLSLSSTGISLPDGHIITHGYSLPKDATVAERVARITHLRDRILTAVMPAGPDSRRGPFASTPPLVVIEGFSFGSPQGATEAGGLGWIIRLALHEHSIPFAIVAPATLKKFATGKGNAGKDDMKLAAQSRLGLTFTGTGSGDRCDARWLQEMGLHHLGAPTVELPAVNLSALAKVEWPS